MYYKYFVYTAYMSVGYTDIQCKFTSGLQICFIASDITNYKQ